MSVYLPSCVRDTRPQAIAQLIRDYPFATLSPPTDAEPQISHLPLLLTPTAPHGALIGHVARANPHWQRWLRSPSIAIFHGPHAYVSPSWYTEPAAMVPTWNYAVVHVHGTVELIDDRDAKRGDGEELTAHFESGRDGAVASATQGRAPRRDAGRHRRFPHDDHARRRQVQAVAESWRRGSRPRDRGLA